MLGFKLNHVSKRHHWTYTEVISTKSEVISTKPNVQTLPPQICRSIVLNALKLMKILLTGDCNYMILQLCIKLNGNCLHSCQFKITDSFQQKALKKTADEWFEREISNFIQYILTHYGLDKMAAIFANEMFLCVFLKENFRILHTISLKYVPYGAMDHKPSLVQVMGCLRTGDKPLSKLHYLRIRARLYLDELIWLIFFKILPTGTPPLPTTYRVSTVIIVSYDQSY